MHCDYFIYFLVINGFCSDWKKNLATPIKYTIGGAEIMDHIPTDLRPYVTPGYMQFRAINSEGKAYAFCPGIR